MVSSFKREIVSLLNLVLFFHGQFGQCCCHLRTAHEIKSYEMTYLSVTKPNEAKYYLFVSLFFMSLQNVCLGPQIKF